MIVPRRLHKTAEHPPYEIVEEDDPRQAWILCGAGTEYSDDEAQALGITAYLEAYDKAHAKEEKAAEPAEPEQAEAKAVAQTEVEDKAVSGPTEEKAAAAKTPEPPPPPDPDDDPGKPKTGVDFPPETRRIGGGGRRGS